MWRSCKSSVDMPSRCIWVQLWSYYPCAEAIIGSHKLYNLCTFIICFLGQTDYCLWILLFACLEEDCILILWIFCDLSGGTFQEMPFFAPRVQWFNCMAGVLLWDQGGLQWFQQCCHRPTDDGHCVLCFFGPRQSLDPWAVRGRGFLMGTCSMFICFSGEG